MGHSMSPETAAATREKRCTICGVDCNGRPRMKDPSGRYFCRPCYDERARSPGRANTGGDDGDPYAGSPPADDYLSMEALPPTVVAPGPGSVPWPAGPATAKAKAKAPKKAVLPGVAITDFLFKSPIARFAPLLAFVFAFAIAFGDAMTQARMYALLNADGNQGAWGDVLLYGGLAALLGAVIHWIIGPFSLRLRLSWSDGDDIERTTSRVVYFFSAAPAALWSAGAALVTMMSFDTPAASLAADGGLPVVGTGGVVVLLAAGCAVTFLTACQSFDASRGKAAFWFVVVPLAWYTLVLSSVLTLASSDVAAQIREGLSKANAQAPQSRVPPPVPVTPRGANAGVRD